MSAPPDRLRAAVELWVQRGCPPQAGIPWPRDRWIAFFPDRHQLWIALPDQLRRADVTAAAAGADQTEAEALTAFLVAMAWGYGNVGYGPWRVQRCLSTDRAAGRLLEAARTAVKKGPVAGYAALGGQDRLTGLGPAFGTKFLYFVSKASSTPVALIFDRLVAGWLRDHAALRINPVTWHLPNYRHYLETVGVWADELKVAADDVELCIFRDAAGSGSGQWATA